MQFISKLSTRAFKYSLVGGVTYLLDMGILLSLITYSNIPYGYAVIIGFIIAIHLNFYLSYHWVFKGTQQTFTHGYIYFIVAALFIGMIIAALTTVLVESFSIPLLYARVSVGTIMGFVNFLFSAFYNFKIL